jgi:BirA family biotin operon repressor/biotin-[acetyl-CoA-carboxylase] ligase
VAARGAGVSGERNGAKTATPAASPLVARLYAALADGLFHSGEDLASALHVTRSAVWKAVDSLRELGASLHAVRNRGYRLTSGREPLDVEKIRERLERGIRDRVHQLDGAWSVGSTNTMLLERQNPPFGSFEVFLAEHQSAGRGRRGRTWVAPLGGSICLSVSWTFREVPPDLGALGLVIGVCSLRALALLGVTDARLKWPNDILVDDRKLGGVLIELRAESAGPACVVIGVGLNVALGAELMAKIAETGVAPIDLVTAMSEGREKDASPGDDGEGAARVSSRGGDAGGGSRGSSRGGAPAVPSRNEIVAGLVCAYVKGLLEFGRDGLKPFIEEWRESDALRGRPVTVQAADGATKGLARGIDLHGALLVETPQGLKKFISGDVSVRATT